MIITLVIWSFLQLWCKLLFVSMQNLAVKISEWLNETNLQFSLSSYILMSNELSSTGHILKSFKSFCIYQDTQVHNSIKTESNLLLMIQVNNWLI